MVLIPLSGISIEWRWTWPNELLHRVAGVGKKVSQTSCPRRLLLHRHYEKNAETIAKSAIWAAMCFAHAPRSAIDNGSPLRNGLSFGASASTGVVQGCLACLRSYRCPPFRCYLTAASPALLSSSGPSAHLLSNSVITSPTFTVFGGLNNLTAFRFRSICFISVVWLRSHPLALLNPRWVKTSASK